MTMVRRSLYASQVHFELSCVIGKCKVAIVEEAETVAMIWSSTNPLAKRSLRQYRMASRNRVLDVSFSGLDDRRIERRTERLHHNTVTAQNPVPYVTDPEHHLARWSLMNESRIRTAVVRDRDSCSMTSTLCRLPFLLLPATCSTT